MMDANLNRSREGLRVCEDVSRFVLGSGPISRRIKSLRHGVTSAIGRMQGSRAALLESRDPAHDVGRASATRSEMRRSGAADLFAANMQRVKESLRVLEEASKIYDVRLAASFRRLRFRAYDVEKDSIAKIRGMRALRDTGCRSHK
jgi:thiamine-phosphate pyrophosphorylase